MQKVRWHFAKQGSGTGNVSLQWNALHAVNVTAAAGQSLPEIV
jgi:hypothetical protein